MTTAELFREAFETRDIERFMALVFPPTWRALAARIIESGATMSDELCAWAPRWSPIPPTVRRGRDELGTWVKSCIFRAHDCIHQLWGLPIPSDAFTEDEFYVYKRAQMCGEVAVLTLTEFVLCASLLERHHDLRPILSERNALPLLAGPLGGKTTAQIAARLDGLLHKQVRPRWVRDCPTATAFVDDYVPMLAHDRRNVDHNWNLMKQAGWRPIGAPNVRYNPDLDGLELTLWLIDDFFHQLGTDPEVDEPLAAFNRARRAGLELPLGWNGSP